MSVKGFRLADGSVAKYDYSALENVITDNTLSISGVAADAETVGNEIAQLEARNFDLDESDRLKISGLSGTTSEVTDRIETLRQYLTAEVSTRSAKDISIEEELAESRDRMAEIETGISESIDRLPEIEEDISESKDRLIELETNLSDEIANRIAADNTEKTERREAVTLEKNERVAADNALSTRINIEKSRIDNIEALPDGATTADAELVNIRIGYDNTEYSSAGNAVRAQISDVKADLSEITDISTISDFSEKVQICPSAEKVLVHSDVYSVYVPIVSGATYVVHKESSTSRFRLGTTANVPVYNEPVIDYVNGDSANTLTLEATGNSKYLLIMFWRTADSPIDPDVVLTSITVTQKHGAKDAIARERISNLEDFENTISYNASKNVLVLSPKVETKNGITITVTDEDITLEGTASANAYFYDFFNASDFVGTFTFGLVNLSGSGSYIVQVPFSTNIHNNDTVTFESAPTSQIIVMNGTVINRTFRLWACSGSTLYDYQPNVITEIVPDAIGVGSINGNAIQTQSLNCSALDNSEYTEGNNIYHISDATEKIYHNEVTYSIKDNVISFNGTLANGGFTLNLPSIVLTGYNTLNIEVISGSYTGTVYFYLPTGTTAFLNSINASTQRMEYFDGTEKTISIYALNGTAFSNFKVRIWITQGLSNKPFDGPHYYIPKQEVMACTSGEYNAPSYARIDDNVLYNVFGLNYHACKNGLISRTNRNNIVKFALLSDLHYTDSEAFYSRIYRKITSDYDVDFCVMTGDIIDSGYYSTPSLYATQITQFKNSVKHLGCPNFPFCGNHDDDVNEFAHHGVIDYGLVRFIYFWADYVSATVGGTVKASELTWIEQQLSQSTAEINILMCHYSISTDTGFDNQLDAESRTSIITLARTYDVLLYLNGHQHDHNVSVGMAGDMTDINLPNGKYAYSICEINNSGVFTLTVYDSTNDEVLKTITVSLLP